LRRSGRLGGRSSPTVNPPRVKFKCYYLYSCERLPATCASWQRCALCGIRLASGHGDQSGRTDFSGWCSKPSTSPIPRACGWCLHCMPNQTMGCLKSRDTWLSILWSESRGGFQLSTRYAELIYVYCVETNGRE